VSDLANGDEFMRVFHRAATGEVDPFILVVEGSIPNGKLKTEGYWAGPSPSPRAPLKNVARIGARLAAFFRNLQSRDPQAAHLYGDV